MDVHAGVHFSDSLRLLFDCAREDSPGGNHLGRSVQAESEDDKSVEVSEEVSASNMRKVCAHSRMVFEFDTVHGCGCVQAFFLLLPLSDHNIQSLGDRQYDEKMLLRFWRHLVKQDGCDCMAVIEVRSLKIFASDYVCLLESRHD